jgi:hypothetical protein
VVAGSPYNALDLETWRSVLARGAVWQSCASCLGELHQVSLTSRDANGAVDQLHVFARSAAATASSDADVIDATVESWSAALDAYIEDPTLPADECELLQEVRRQVQSATAADPFSALFARLVAKALDVYGEDWQTPQFSLSHLPLHPRSPTPGDPYGVSATTDSGSAPVVELWIHPDGLGPAAYTTIPYLFLHELICHVPARQRGEVDNASVFAEGFMDWVALRFFEEWIGEVDTAMAPAAEEHSRELGSILANPLTPEGAARRRGHRAATRVVAWLVGEVGIPHQEAVFAVARLAMELNKTDAQLVSKDALVVALNGTWSQDLREDLLAVTERRKAAGTLL